MCGRILFGVWINFILCVIVFVYGEFMGFF